MSAESIPAPSSMTVVNVVTTPPWRKNSEGTTIVDDLVDAEEEALEQEYIAETALVVPGENKVDEITQTNEDNKKSFGMVAEVSTDKQTILYRVRKWLANLINPDRSPPES
jgi:hypothetical protein